MAPNINVYDIVISKREKNYNKNDVISFYSKAINTGGYTVTHRISRILNSKNEKKYITKGDANATEDLGYVTNADIVGKVILVIPKLGYLQFLLSSKAGWFLVILIPTIAYMIFDIYKLKKVILIKKNINMVSEKKDQTLYEEKEENKKLIALLDKAEKINKNAK